MSDDDAALLADSLVQADLRGIHSHGVLRVPDYVAKLTREGVNPRGVPRVARRTGGAIVVDGDNSMGQIGGVFAMRQAIDAARTAGVAAAVGGSNHAGTMDYFGRSERRRDAPALRRLRPCGQGARIGQRPALRLVVAGIEEIVWLNHAHIPRWWRRSGCRHGKPTRGKRLTAGARRPRRTATSP